MAAGSSNPLRQQMINMMYLVLTALLALNVSAEILEAFQTVNEGMDKSLAIINEKNNNSTQKLENLLLKTPDATDIQVVNEKAKLVNNQCNSLFDYVEGLKRIIINQSGGYEADSVTMRGMKDFEKTTRLMVDKGKGDELMIKCGELHNSIIKIMSTGVEGLGTKELVNDWVASNIIIDEEKSENPAKTWAEESFHMVPGIATITLLTKIQTDIRNTQANAMTKLETSIGAEQVVVDKFIPVINVITGKSAVSIGEEYKAEILLAAYDSKQVPEIYLQGKRLEVKDGKASFTGSTGTSGSHSLTGEIVVKNKKTGKSTKYPYTLAYDVFQSAAIVSATNMNVVYIGLDNPIEVSVPGYKPGNVMASVSGPGSLKMTGPGKYICTVRDTRGKQRKIKINVSVKEAGGGTRGIGGTEFRIYQVPKPIAFFGSKASGSITRAELKGVSGIVARLDGFVFEGVKYKVTRYAFLFVSKRGGVQSSNGKGNRLSGTIRGMIAKAVPGDKIIITNVYVRGPGGEKRLPTGCVLSVR